MNIMIDTNIIISAALFPGKQMKELFTLFINEYNLFLSTYSLSEVERVIARKFPEKARTMAIFLHELRYTIIYTPTIDILGKIAVRDPKDAPILASALSADVDILITGDHDFEAVDMERPKIMSVSEFFIEEFGR